MKKSMEDGTDHNLALLSFRNTPVLNSFTPAQILMSRHLRENLPVLENKLEPKVINKSIYHSKLENQKVKSQYYYNRNAKLNQHEYCPNTTIRFQEKPKSTWQLGKIVQKIRPRTYKIRKGDGKYIVRNAYYIKPTIENVDFPDPENDCKPYTTDEYVYSHDESKIVNSSVSNNSDSDDNSDSSSAEMQEESVVSGQSREVDVEPLQRPKRTVTLPAKFKEFVVES